MDADKDVEVITKETVFQGYFRVDRYRLRHRTFAGGWTDEMVREVFERGHAVVVLLYDPDRDEVALIEQFRPGAFAAGWNPWLIECVAGIIDEGEPRAGAATCRAEPHARARRAARWRCAVTCHLLLIVACSSICKEAIDGGRGRQ